MTEIVLADKSTEPETHGEEVWNPMKDWIAVQAQSPGGLTSFSKFSVNYFETGTMQKKSPIGVTQSKCLIVHFQNGQSSGIPTLDPEALHGKILELMEEKPEPE